jgi:hypothetical protein
VKRIARRAWNSPTFTTWLSHLTRTGNLFLVLPLILNRFDASEVAIWYLFAGIISLGSLADFGFRATFIRLIALAHGGATHIGVVRHSPESRGPNGPNWSLVAELYSAMARVYRVTSALVLLGLAIGGTIALIRPVSQSPFPNSAWLAWSIVAATAAVEFWGKTYKNYLEGLSEIALVRRIEAVFRVGAIATSFAVMFWAPSLLNLVIANRVWGLANTARDRFLATRVHDRRLSSFADVPPRKEFLGQVWAPAWRTGISGLMSTGLSGLTGIWYAQIGSPAAVASYLLALKLVTEIRNFSNAPFYSRIPRITRLRARGAMHEFVADATRGINLAVLVFVVGVLLVGFSSSSLIDAVGSKTPFVPLHLWWLICVAFLLHRIGAFQMQLYLTTNHVIAHLVDGAAGLVFIAAVYLMLPRFGVSGFPLAMILAYGVIYLGPAFHYSRTSLPVSSGEFLARFALVPGAALAVLVSLAIVAW